MKKEIKKRLEKKYRRWGYFCTTDFIAIYSDKKVKSCPTIKVEVKTGKISKYLPDSIREDWKWVFKGRGGLDNNEDALLIINDSIYVLVYYYRYERERCMISTRSFMDYGLLPIKKFSKRELAHIANILRKELYRNVKRTELRYM